MTQGNGSSAGEGPRATLARGNPGGATLARGNPGGMKEATKESVGDDKRSIAGEWRA